VPPHFTLLVNGQAAVDWSDPDPLTWPDTLSLCTWGSGSFSQVRIYRAAG
jgi:hypothetical protein